MELTQPQRDAVRKKIEAIFGDHEPANCEMCGHDGWAIDPYILELREFGKGAVYVGVPVVPIVSMHCMKCGNSKLFNAISLGVIDQSTGNIDFSIKERAKAVESMTVAKAVAVG